MAMPANPLLPLPLPLRRAFPPSSLSVKLPEPPLRWRRRQVSVASVADDGVEGIISGEWPENFSLLSYDDLRAYLEPQILKDKMSPKAFLGEVMSAPVKEVTVDRTLGEIEHHFEIVSGLPVVDEEGRCVGIVSKKDRARASRGSESTVGEIMSSPAITLSPQKRVIDAAVLMLKNKVHRIPVVNEKMQVIGIVTRTDIFQALEVSEV